MEHKKRCISIVSVKKLKDTINMYKKFIKNDKIEEFLEVRPVWSNVKVISDKTGVVLYKFVDCQNFNIDNTIKYFFYLSPLVEECTIALKQEHMNMLAKSFSVFSGKKIVHNMTNKIIFD